MPGSVDFEAIFDRSPNSYMLLAPDLTFVGANEAYLRSTFTRREDLIGRPLFDVFPGDPDDPDGSDTRMLRESLELVLEQRKPDTLALIRYAIPRRTPEGVTYERRYWSVTHTPILDEAGEVSLILQHTVDVTEVQQLRKALRAGEVALGMEGSADQIEDGLLRRAQTVQDANRTLEAERRELLQLFQQAPGFIAVVRGPDHVFQLANEAYYQVVGHRDIIGKPVREALPEVESQGFIDLLDEVYQTGKPYVGREVPILLERQPGSELDEIYVDFVYQPIVEPDGSISGIFAQGHEVTEQKRAQEELRSLNETLEQRVAQRTDELEARNRELQEFAYVASHDLQEPLRKVRSFADLVVEDYSEAVGEEGRAFLERIRSSTLRMSTLIQDLLDYSRVATKERGFEPVDLNEVAQDVIGDLQMRIEETGGRVDVDSLPVIEADPLQMRQLLQNLISNGLKFHRPDVPPVVSVSAHVETPEGAEDPVCRLEVCDNGIGFPEKHAERVFAPFQRLHNRDTYGGTGIGLAICRRIAERHGGSISARSTPGEGSTFVVRLPARQEPTPA